jgi:hypothetical protein
MLLLGDIMIFHRDPLIEIFIEIFFGMAARAIMEFALKPHLNREAQDLRSQYKTRKV